MTDIALAARDAPVGATLLFEAGRHTLTDTLIIARGDITLKGAGRDKTTIVIDHDDAEGIRFDGDDPVWERKLTVDVTQGSRTLTLPPGTDVKAGDVLGLHMANDSSLLKYGPYNIVKNSEYWDEKPLRESLVEVDHVVGNLAYLKHEIAFDMTAGSTTLSKYNLLQNVHMSDMTVTYDLGAPKDPHFFSNPLTGYTQATAILIQGTLGLDVRNLSVVNAASSGLIIRRALEPVVDNYLADGAHNTGSDKNGYGLSIEEVFYGKFTNLDLINIRHSFLFSGWNAEAYNDVHIRTMNRDVNYHGGPDRSNTVLVDYANYLDGRDTDGSRKSWGLVDDGGDPNPPTDISKNVNLFKIAFGSYRDETLFGWNGGAYLDGREGNDVLTGGKGRDVLVGGIGGDTVTGREGRDWFVVKAGDGDLTVTDFATGATGDILVLNGFHANSLAALPWRQTGHDAALAFEGITVTLKNVTLGSLLGANIAFNLTGLVPSGDLPLPPPSDPAAPLNLTGSNGAELLTGTHGVNTIHGLSGNDQLIGRDGNDILYGDDGNDILEGGWDDDKLYGGAGDDVLDGGPGNDFIDGGTGSDRVLGGVGNDTFVISRGDNGMTVYDFSTGDRIVVRGYTETALRMAHLSQSGSDAMLSLDDGTTVSLRNVRIGLLTSGNLLADIDGRLTALPHDALSPPSLKGTAGDDLIEGRQGVDNVIDGRGGNDIISGRDGSDRLYGGDGDDTLYGNWHNDLLDGGRGRDTLDGGPGEDTLTGGDGNDRLEGGADKDRLYGETGDDVLNGGAGVDVINGGGGNDRLDGGDGRDYLYGGTGNDVFVFGRLSDAADVLIDFRLGEDRIDLDALLTGRATASVTTISGQTGLYLDPDGPGAARAVLLATFEDPLRPGVHLSDLLA